MVLHEPGVIDVNGLTPDTLFDEAELESGGEVEIPDPLFKLNGDGGCDPSIGALRAELDGWFLNRDRLLSTARDILGSCIEKEPDDILVYRFLMYVRAQRANIDASLSVEPLDFRGHLHEFLGSA